MLADQFLRDCSLRVEDLIRRFDKATADLSEDDLNAHPNGVHWSIGEITEHLRLANGFYLPVIDEGLKAAIPANSSEEVSHTRIGKLVAYGAGPRKASPAPRVLHPGRRHYERASLASFDSDHHRLLYLMESSKSRSLIKTRMPNPFMKFFKMNLADFFLILVAHGERHVGQIEDIANSLRSS